MRRPPASIIGLFLLFTAGIAAALVFLAREESARRQRLLAPENNPPHLPAATNAPVAPVPDAPPAPPAPDSSEPAPPPESPLARAERAIALYRDAEAALRDSDYATAETLALDSLALQPRYAPALRVLGHAYVCQGRAPDALRVLREALAVEPLHPQALCDLSLAFFLDKNPVAALETIETCRRVYPDDPAALIQHGMILLTVPDRYDEAIDVLSRASAVFPDNLVIRNNLAIAYLRTAQWDLAESTLDAILDADPANSTALYHHAALHFLQDDFPSAIPWLRRALQAAVPAQRNAILGDPDLDPFRRDPLFLSLLDEFDPASSIRIQQ